MAPTSRTLLPKKMKRKPSHSRIRRRPKQTPNWLELPPDVTASILHRVGAIDILTSVQKVCTTWRRICKEPAMWRVIDMHNLGDLGCMPYNLETMCRHAVDRSQGQLLDINIEYFGNEELLEYIADRSSQLRCLRVVICHYLSTESLNEVVKKLPLLEEFHLYYTYIHKEAIETIGRSCPLLKSFTLNQKWIPHSPMDDDNDDDDDDDDDDEVLKDDDEVLAIAKNMPGLWNLQLLGNNMTDIGLQAILDGCPHLDSLDLRQCFNIKFNGDLGKRCSKIRDLKCPFDSTEGYKFDTSLGDDMDPPDDETSEDFWW